MKIKLFVLVYIFWLAKTELENSDNFLLNQLLPELLRSGPDLDRIKRESIQNSHKTSTYRRDHQKKPHKSSKKKDFIQVNDLDPIDSDNLQEFSIDDTQGFNAVPLKIKSDDYAQSTIEEYDMGGSESVGGREYKSQTGDITASDDSQSQTFGGFITDDPNQSQYIIGAKSNEASQNIEKNNDIYASLKQNAENENTDSFISSQPISDQDYISLGQHQSQKITQKNGQMANQSPQTQFNDDKAQGNGDLKSSGNIKYQNHASNIQNFGQKNRPIHGGHPNQNFKDIRFQSGQNSISMLSHGKGSQKNSEAMTIKSSQGRKQIFKNEQISGKLSQINRQMMHQNLAKNKQIIAAMSSGNNIPEETTIVEVVLDCSTCGMKCPKHCENENNQDEKNETDIIDKNCCGKSLMRIPSLCPKCAFIDTSSCPVSATEFETHDEMYHILEIGLKDPYVPEMGDVQSAIFQKIRRIIQSFILRVFHDDPYYQDTLIKEIKNSKEHAIVSMVLRFTKQNNGNVSPLYKALMCKCGCDAFNVDLFFKLTPANTSDIIEYCPSFCGLLDEETCNANTNCIGCCYSLVPVNSVTSNGGGSSYGGQSTNSFSQHNMPDYSSLLQQMPFIIPVSQYSGFGGNMCPGNCPAACFPMCAHECCNQLSFGIKRSMGRYRSHPYRTNKS